MVAAIWLSALVQRLWLRQMSWRGAALEASIAVPVMAGVLWACGFFLTSSLGISGFGYYRMNLLSLFDSNGWSLLWPSLPKTGGDYEGMIFPGLGVLLLLALGLAGGGSRLGAALRPRWLPLLVVVAGLALFALSNKPELGGIALGTVPLPGVVLDFASMFRASGRMIWPAGYLLTALAFGLLQRRLGDRALVTLASLAVVLQAIDSSDQWRRFATAQPAPAQAWASPLRSPFWALAATHYTRIRAISARSADPWPGPSLAYFSAFHNLGTDAAYLGRRDAQARGDARHVSPTQR